MSPQEVLQYPAKRRCKGGKVEERRAAEKCRMVEICFKVREQRSAVSLLEKKMRMKKWLKKATKGTPAENGTSEDGFPHKKLEQWHDLCSISVFKKGKGRANKKRKKCNNPSKTRIRSLHKHISNKKTMCCSMCVYSISDCRWVWKVCIKHMQWMGLDV